MLGSESNHVCVCAYLASSKHLQLPAGLQRGSRGGPGGNRGYRGAEAGSPRCGGRRRGRWLSVAVGSKPEPNPARSWRPKVGVASLHSNPSDCSSPLHSNPRPPLCPSRCLDEGKEPEDLQAPCQACREGTPENLWKVELRGRFTWVQTVFWKLMPIKSLQKAWGKWVLGGNDAHISHTALHPTYLCFPFFQTV